LILEYTTQFDIFDFELDPRIKDFLVSVLVLDGSQRDLMIILGP
jgi:hypothetical protein